VTLTAIFEASEVQTPTCFIILPEKVTLSLSDVASKFSKKVDYIRDVLDKAKHCIEVLDNESGLESTLRVLKCIDAVGYIGDVLDNMTDCVGAPFKFAAAFVKSTLFESTMFL
jgi:hypothetical protein